MNSYVNNLSVLTDLRRLYLFNIIQYLRAPNGSPYTNLKVHMLGLSSDADERI